MTKKEREEKQLETIAWIITAIIVIFLIINIEYVIALGILFFICCLVWLIGVLF